MDKAQAIFNFWNNFGLPVYDEFTIPTGKDMPSMPYITYSTSTDSLGGVVSLSGNLWFFSTSWEQISEKAEEISAFIGMGGLSVPIDGGYLWICRGQPFAQRMDDDQDTVRRIYINLQAEFLTAD